MIVDTSALFAFFVSSDPAHAAATAAIAARRSDEELVISPLVIAELDYLIASRFDVEAELQALRELSGGAWRIAELTVDDLASSSDIVEKYRDQDIGVTDASLVVLAEKHKTQTVATLDRRHFSILRSFDGTPFRLVP
jgi:predicted nucleic acid-binding protein